jgi:hypothetical protein
MFVLKWIKWMKEKIKTIKILSTLLLINETFVHQVIKKSENSNDFWDAGVFFLI